MLSLSKQVVNSNVKFISGMGPYWVEKGDGNRMNKIAILIQK